MPRVSGGPSTSLLIRWTLVLEAIWISAALLVPLPTAQYYDGTRARTTTSTSSLVAARNFGPSLNRRRSSFRLFFSLAKKDLDADAKGGKAMHLNGLMASLNALVDKYILTGSPKVREKIFNVMDQIVTDSGDDQLAEQALRLVKRAGVPMNKTFLEKYQNELGKTDSEQRRLEVKERREWEASRETSTNGTGSKVAGALNGDNGTNNGVVNGGGGRSALSRREAGTNGDKPDLFMNSVLNPDDIATIANDKEELQKELEGGTSEPETIGGYLHAPSATEASIKVSEVIAKTGAGANFNGETLGIGGLDEVLTQVKRRVWTPLAAPPQLLAELGIHPVRGLLLYGKPGCGKTLLARTLGSLLSPMRPITVVSGPEIMDKFVGSSEKNLRDIFDSPPDIYDKYRIGEKDGGEGIARAALHVVVMDEFDAVARARGGRGGKGEQGDAGVARDSVVNQLLAKMDGVNPLPVPTLVVGLTNKRSLIDTALLRPGRFEVQVEVPPPRTDGQRVSILKVHTRQMHAAGRLLVSDPPEGTASDKYNKDHPLETHPSYDDLLLELAGRCEGYSGAALAGVARASASHALERAVAAFSNAGSDDSATSLMDCLVTQQDFWEAVEDVKTSLSREDSADDGDEDSSKEDVKKK